MTQDELIELIDPQEWVAVRAYTYEGVTYGRGEPVPVMPLATAEQFMIAGKIQRSGAVGLAASAERRRPKTAEQYLRGDDRRILTTLREFPPDTATLQVIAGIAKRKGRSPALREAIQLAIDRVAP
jgi:hypothetical protein